MEEWNKRGRGGSGRGRRGGDTAVLVALMCGGSESRRFRFQVLAGALHVGLEYKVQAFRLKSRVQEPAEFKFLDPKPVQFSKR